MSERPTILFFFNDWPVNPDGANCGGGETATMSLAEAFARQGYRTIGCASLPDGDVTVRGVEYWDFGSDYRVHDLLPRIRELGIFYAFTATLVHPFLLLHDVENCARKILVNHSPGINPSGLESRTVMHLIDRFVCVSEAQKQRVLARGQVPEERMTVIRNGFNPELFKYAGPEGRNWNQLLYAGRLEHSKGIHFLLGAFTNLRRIFPELRLAVYGDQSCWPSLQEQIPQIQASTPGLTFHGKVPQAQIAQQLQAAGCLVFPSLSFESAGLSVLDAQASGCPVIASDAGGVREYLSPECGMLVENLDPQKLEEALMDLLSHPERMVEMSNNGERLARGHTWDVVAEELIVLAAEPVPELSPLFDLKSMVDVENPLTIIREHDALYRTWFETGFSYETLMEDHDHIASGVVIDDDTLFSLSGSGPEHAIISFWKGLRLDALGRKQEALQALLEAFTMKGGRDWQSAFRLVLLETELGELSLVENHATALLTHEPMFPMRDDVERLLNEVNATQAGVS